MSIAAFKPAPIVYVGIFHHVVEKEGICLFVFFRVETGIPFGSAVLEQQEHGERPAHLSYGQFRIAVKIVPAEPLRIGMEKVRKNRPADCCCTVRNPLEALRSGPYAIGFNIFRHAKDGLLLPTSKKKLLLQQLHVVADFPVGHFCVTLGGLQ